ncbi:MAG: OmpA family protein [Thermoanaerobaculales bacterium]|jgi:outer membrane protein OmpA-like peptidoglycan-associated protein|nr:OmpA family protein [Thermoanaerobaculales bacterium]
MKKTALALPLLVGAAALAGCQTYQERPKTVTGAGIGAATGALIGSQVAGRGNRTAGGFIGAAVGGLAGGLIGNYMDEQERALRQQTAGTGIDVQRQGESILMNLPEGVSFDVGSAAIKPQFYPALDRVAETLRQYENTVIEVAGHTDSTGSMEMNQRLSENRANAVRSYLVSRGVSPNRISAVGYGKTRPIADNGTAAGRAQNRRVEIIVTPVQ